MNAFAAKRPFVVTLTAGGVFILGLWNAARVAALFHEYDLLTRLAVRPSPAVQIEISAVWAAMFLWAGMGLWRKRPLAVRLIPVILIIYAVYKTAALFLFANSFARQAWLLTLLLYGGGAAFSWWALRRPSARHYFKR